MAKINLTQGMVAIVDDQDFDWLNQYKWHLRNGYVMHSRWDPVTKRVIHVRMHRLILNPDEDFETDHINRDRLDNRRSNLRMVTRSQNCTSKSIYKNNTSGYKGVGWNKISKKWRSQIGVGGKTKNLGMYKDKKTAALAYNIAAIGYHGKFAVLNDLTRDGA